MKKIITSMLVLVALCAGQEMNAQQISTGQHRMISGERSPAIQPANSILSPQQNQAVTKHVNPGNGIQNIFDIQFNYPLSFAAGVSCVYTGTEFWVGRWNVDSLYKIGRAHV